MEKYITVKEATAKAKDDNEWVELIDQEGKTHRVFSSLQNSEGEWLHFEKEIDILKGEIDDGSIVGLALKLTKEKKGKFWNIIAMEIVKDEFKKQAMAEVEDSREDSIEAQTSQKGGIEILKTLIEQALLTDKEIQKCKEYAMSSVEWAMARLNLPSVIVTKIEEAKSETTKANNKSETTDQQPSKERTTGQVSREALELLPGETERVRKFFDWIMSKDKNIKEARLWLTVEYGIPKGEALSDAQCEALYKTIKTKMKW